MYVLQRYSFLSLFLLNKSLKLVNIYIPKLFFDREYIRSKVLKFDREIFKEKIKAFIEDALARHIKNN